MSLRGSFSLCLNAAAALIPQTGSPEVPSMEGTLERKQKLQRGGKKVKRDSFGAEAWRCSGAHALISLPQASSRGWNCYHAVVSRHTLGFYQNRSSTLWVSETRRSSQAASTRLSSTCSAVELCRGPPSGPQRSPLFSSTGLHQEAQLLQVTVRLDQEHQF